MDIRNYTSFVAVAELMNFTKAAERLNITQSALSRQVKALEDYLGVKLFEKTGRNIRFTPQGEALLAKINNVLVADRELRTFAGDLTEGESGLLKIGACSQLIERYMPSFLKKWTEDNPDIEIRLEDGGGPELAAKLADGAFHLTISAEPSAPIEILESRPLGHLGFLAVGTAEFLGHKEDPIEIEQLLSLPILTLNKKHVSREVFDAACRVSGTVPRVVLESNSPHTLLAMSIGGNGVAVVPSSTQPQEASLRSRPIALKGELISFGICAMWNIRQPLPAYGQRFIDSLENHICAEQQQEEFLTHPAQYGRLQVI
ncbi:LysR family transcriptional regulator [uncultured Cohaesibacter sp.]|uniref:LysR family transcriptional regulator n=1 Tax=uncultured Cohaesibacter sp. TaxID=1002546 RepID=UPI0029C7F50E|nr:LysR family transcriptional regulator [uncultured Cohaesibacter sp.]